MVQHRPVPAAHRLLSLDIVLALLALAGGLRVLYLAAPEPALPTEAATVAHAYALGNLTSFADAGGAGVSPFGWLQLAAATMVSDAFGRSATALAAVRETVLVAALAIAVLTWLLARRLGLTRWAAAAAVLLPAASPLALGLQRLVVVEHLAAAWALGALVLITRRRARIRHDIAAAACLLAAVLTSPLALFFLPAAGWLLVRRAPARAALVVVLLNLGLGIAFGPAASVLRPHLAAATRPSVADWAALDPVWVALSLAALAAAMAVRAMRPLAATGSMLAATLLVPGVPDTAVLALLVPVTPVLLAGVAQAATRHRAPARHGRADRLLRTASAAPAPHPSHREAASRPGQAEAPPAASTPHIPHREAAISPGQADAPSAALAHTTHPEHTNRPETSPAAVPRHGRAVRRRAVPVLAAGVLVVALGVSWSVGYPALRPAVDRGSPLSSAREWLHANASGSRLLVDDAAWAELADSGWPTGLLAPPASCSVACPPAEWAVFGSDATSLRQHYPALDGALVGAGPTAVFGDGGTRVTVWRLGLPPPDPAAPPETSARAHAGEALAASARITLAPGAAAVLRDGCADPRLIATIAALAAIQPVDVAAFPGIPGEDAAGQPRRRVLLRSREDETAAFYAGQRDLFRPASVVRTAGGVLVTYPLFAPPGLLPQTR
ncbi:MULTISPECIES: glycosyl transferase [unclassified Amycolatopsis]|uniref:glycosyl transferase n=1 Tax=unclassified Amycolatopsis TaxID=2618356 RepID=UPI00287B6B31|nr:MULTISPECIES: glycosyl transferase [unclassified Amycolatopsis]